MSDRLPKIELLIGMIASGKSTYARKRADEGALVVSHDDLTQMLHACYRYEPGLKPAYRAMMREMFRTGEAAWKLGPEDGGLFFWALDEIDRLRLEIERLRAEVARLKSIPAIEGVAGE